MYKNTTDHRNVNRRGQQKGGDTMLLTEGGVGAQYS
jgi:hypothetical protein